MKVRAAEDDFGRKNCHGETRNVGTAQIEFGRADQGDAERAEGVAERRPLRDGGHLHQPERYADAGPEHQRDRNRLVVDDTVLQQSPADSQQHANFARPDAVPGRARRAHPFQRQE